MITYHGLQTLYNAITARERAEMAAAFPETGGHPQYVHNWIICGKDEYKAARAELIRNSYRARWTRLRARYERESARREHLTHISQQRAGEYLWCRACIAMYAA